jgi:hypothetical protein
VPPLPSSLRLGALFLVGHLTLSGGDALHAPFEALPPETIGALRLDLSPSTRAAFAEQTRLGAALLAPEKLAALRAIVERWLEASEAGREVAEKLTDLGLEPADLYPALASHLGAAIVLQPTPDKRPLPTLLVWAGMAPESADKVLRALLRAAEEEPGMELYREDAGAYDIYRVRAPGEGYSFLLAQLQNRLFFAIGQEPPDPDAPAQTLVPDAAPALPVPDPAYEAAELHALGRFLQAQEEGNGGFLRRFYDDPGIRSARPTFPARTEVLVDLPAAFALLGDDGGPTPTSLEGFTRMAFWNGLVDRHDRTRFFLGMPEPRRGFAALFEIERFAFQVPEWVPAGVKTYSAASVDFAHLYRTGIEIARGFVPPAVLDQQLTVANEQLGALFATDLEMLFAAFGNRLHFLEFPARIDSVTMGDTTIEVPLNPQVLVVDFGRPDILEAAFTMAAAALGSSPSAGMERIQEQGFSGLRLASPQGPIVIAQGLGKLVFTLGEGTSSRLFSHLNTAPEGEAALRFDPAFRAAFETADTSPGIAFGYTDGAKAMGELHTLFAFLERVLGLRQTPDDASAWNPWEEVRKLLPDEEELKTLMGPIQTRGDLTPRGLTFESVISLP